MTIRSEFNKIIKKLSEIPVGIPGYYDLPPFREVVALFSRSLPETVKFLDRACDTDQLGWMSKGFYQISANLKSWEFIDALKRAAMRYSRQTDRSFSSNIVFRRRKRVCRMKFIVSVIRT